MGSSGRVAALLLAVACATTPPERRREDALPGEPLAAGLAALAARDYGEAERQLAEAARRYPALEDYTLYFRARAAARAGRPADALSAAHALRERHPESVWLPPSLLLSGETLRASGDRDGARAALAAAHEALPRGDARWARASVGLAELSAETAATPEEWAGALALAREMRRARPHGPAARRARRLSDRIRVEHPPLDAADRVEEAELRVREGDPEGARDEALAALAAAPDPALTARALWTRAQAERALRLPEAETTCATLAREVPADPLAPRALQAAAGWRWNADDDPAALALFRDLTQRFPVSPQAPEAWYAIGRIYQEEGAHDPARYPDAVAAYTQLVERYPDAPLADEARWRAGWVRYLAGDFTRAERAFATAGRRTRGPARQAAEYWRARTLDRLGDEESARARLAQLADHHPTSYYAGLAEERLGRTPTVLAPPTAAPRPSFPPELAGPPAERAVLLDRLGFPRFARRELDALRAAGAPSALLVLAYQALGAPGPALRVARDLERGDAESSPDLYPLGYWETVRPAAEARGLDPFLVAALIRQESLFEPEAVSPANAHGLMQLLPSTAQELSRANGTPPPEPSALHEPAVNVALGVALLARLHARYDGSVPKALAAYNAGEDAVAKWERRYGSREPDEFVELISYRETRDYVKRVLRNYRVYRRLYGRPPDASAEASSAGSPPNAPFDMITMTSPGFADWTR